MCWTLPYESLSSLVGPVAEGDASRRGGRGGGGKGCPGEGPARFLAVFERSKSSAKTPPWHGERVQVGFR